MTSALEFTLLGALCGSILVIVTRLLVDTWRQRRGAALLGTWKSIYRPDFRNDERWILEDIEIGTRFGHLSMENRNNPSDDYYVVHAEVFQGSHLIGHWFSKRPGANAYGVIILVIHPLGDLMHGYFVGPGDTGERVYCGWVLARQACDLGKGIDLLNSSLHLARRDTIPPAVQDATTASLPSLDKSESLRRSVRVFFSYSHQDQVLRDELEKHLMLLQRQRMIESWHYRRIAAGEDWAQQVDQNLDEADIILLLVSADFMHSDYCYHVEMSRALERHRSNSARVIPVILRPVDWQGSPFGELQALPKGGKPVTTWANQDDAWYNVTNGIRLAIEAHLHRSRHTGVR